MQNVPDQSKDVMSKKKNTNQISMFGYDVNVLSEFYVFGAGMKMTLVTQPLHTSN